MSRILEIFACGIRNLGNFCVWSPESWKCLHVETGILEIFAFGIRNLDIFLQVESGILEIFACGIQNLGNVCLLNPESWALESGIPLTTGIQVPLKKIWTPVPGIRNPWRGVQNPRLP